MNAPRYSALLHVPGILPLVFAASGALGQTDTSALEWLQRIYTAAQTLNYAGTFVYHQGQQV